MARIRGKDTGPERSLADELERQGLTWESHVRELPGCPDFVFPASRVAVFVDGDFWHGRKFQEWRDKLSEKWEDKIASTRRRDRRNRRMLRTDEWVVLAFWETDIKSDVGRCARRVLREVSKSSQPSPTEPGQLESDLVPGGDGDSNT